jgi:hypothetical protein
MNNKVLGSIMFSYELWDAETSTDWIKENGFKEKLYKRNPHFTTRNIVFFQKTQTRYSRRQQYQDMGDGITFVWFFKKKLRKEYKEITNISIISKDGNT